GGFGVGAVAGAYGSHALRLRYSNEAIARGGSVGFMLATAGAALSPFLVTTMALLLIAGAGWVLVLATFNATVQLSTPRWVVGRALSRYQMLTFAGMASGSWLWGQVTEEYGVAIALLSSVGLLLISILQGWRSPLPQAAELNLDPLRRWREPAVALELS